MARTNDWDRLFDAFEKLEMKKNVDANIQADAVYELYSRLDYEDQKAVKRRMNRGTVSGNGAEVKA